MRIETLDTIPLKSLAQEIWRLSGIPTEENYRVMCCALNDLGCDANNWSICIIDLSQILEKLQEEPDEESLMIIDAIKKIMEDQGDDAQISVEGYSE